MTNKLLIISIALNLTLIAYCLTVRGTLSTKTALLTDCNTMVDNVAMGRIKIRYVGEDR